jgi:hypothetical protein
MVTETLGPAPLVPPHLPRDHPLVTRDYSLYTPPIQRMVDQLAVWIDNQVEGATIYGPSRFGKSSAVDHWVQTLLGQRYGNTLPMVVWSHTDAGGANSVGRFYACLLHASKHPLKAAVRSPLSRQHMLMERWHSLAAQSGGRFLILIIDEAQGMSQREWLWLVELHSLLEKEQLRLCVFSVASLQFFDEPMSLAMVGGAHVAARFMLEAERFHGIAGIDELATVMAGYDEGTEWPVHSGKSFTESVAAEAWAQGFRLENHAEVLHKLLLDALPPNYAGPDEFPMKSIAYCCRNVLLRIAGGADWRDVTSVKNMSQTVAESGHRQLLALVTATAHLAKRSLGRRGPS